MESGGGGYGGEVDDAAGAVVWEIGHDGLGEEEGTKDVDSVLPVEVVGCDFFKGAVVGDIGIVDEDVDFKVVAGGFYDAVDCQCVSNKAVKLRSNFEAFAR